MKSAIDNEKGIALVLVLMVMLLMSILGAMLFSSSTTELQISRNYRVRVDAFYAAERGVEYGQGDATIYTTIGTGTLNIPLGGVSLQVGDSDATGTVEFLRSGLPPRGSGADATQFGANYFLIGVAGTGPGNSTSSQETITARIVPL
ncbi:MAG: hypothetical protein GY721_07190 [Deltaproteobacteria bacterium]|nr:hypothetical protein [Deltaproteobacteria bacterium]